MWLKWSQLGAVCLIALVAEGCATPPEIYHLTEVYYVDQQIEFEDAGPQIEQGRPIPLIDGLNHYVLSLPTKLLLLNWQVLDHELSEERLRIVEHYLEMNQLRSVKVRHNQYDPIGEFKRLLQNHAVGPGYRATLGLVSWLRYTLFPDRLFAGMPIPFVGGGDHFNPFTNSVNVYSSDITVLLHEVGHAKDYVQHEWKGTSFALIRLLPGIDLMQEATASSDAIRFLQCIHRPDDELRAYRTLIPAYSTYIAGYFRGGLAVTLPVVFVGHVGGRIQAWQRERTMAAEMERDPTTASRFTRGDFMPPYCEPFPPLSSRPDRNSDESKADIPLAEE